jgi:hypothetical protein
MLSIIQTNAERLRRLNQAVNPTAQNRSLSSEDHLKWKEACEAFHREYDQLAFPGGLMRGLEKIAAGDLMTCVVALEYLEHTPYCFRSQYVATKLRRVLSKVSLPDHLSARLSLIKSGKRRKPNQSLQPTPIPPDELEKSSSI